VYIYINIYIFIYIYIYISGRSLPAANPSPRENGIANTKCRAPHMRYRPHSGDREEATRKNDRATQNSPTECTGDTGRRRQHTLRQLHRHRPPAAATCAVTSATWPQRRASSDAVGAPVRRPLSRYRPRTVRAARRATTPL
jgi:hypothetical protein